jgi:drug/metabolite transporter (DMT)-like permease
MPRKIPQARSPSPPQAPTSRRADSPTFTPKGYVGHAGSPPPSTQKSYSFFSIGVTSLFSLTSIAMVLANKCVVAIRPEDGTRMLLVQVAFTAVVMASYALLSAPSTFDLRKVLSWCPCALLFTSNIVTSVMALEYITVPAFSVLRNVQPFIATLLGVYLLPLLNPSAPAESTSFYKLYALLLILIGTGIYAWKDIEFNVHGYLWVFAHICSMSLYVALVKSKGSGKDALPSLVMSL